MTPLGHQVAQSIILSATSYPLKNAVGLSQQQAHTNGVFPVRRTKQLILFPCAGSQGLGKRIISYHLINVTDRFANDYVRTS